LYDGEVFLKRKTEGSVLCTSCGVLVGVNDETCYNCGRRNPGLWGYAPALRNLGQDLGFVPLVMAGTIVMFALSVLLSGSNMQMLTLSPSPQILFLLGASGAVPVFGFGRWWTLLTASWLHAGVLHIFFNVLWVRQLAPAIAELYGPARMVIIYVVSGVAGFALSSLAGMYLTWLPIPFLRGSTSITVGASASIFGLLGAAVFYGRRSGSTQAARTGLQYALIMGLFGLIFPGVDNYAHAGGFAGGYLAGLVLDPLTRERVDHMIIAIACLAATLIAVVASVITALPLLMA
jgi:membrane associated rhomboid family serine protease